MTMRSSTIAANASRAAATSGSVRHGERRVGVGAERRDERRARGADPSTSVADAVKARAHRAGVESRGPAGERAADRLGDVVGQRADAVRTAERRVGEVQDPQVGSPVAQHRGHEREVVVVDEHRLAMARVGRDRVGELLVDRDVRGPRLAEAGVEAGSANEVEQPVMQEPERRVAEPVEVQALLALVDVEQPEVEPVDGRRAGAHRGAIVVAARRRDPPGVGLAREQRRERAHHATGASVSCEAATGFGVERDRAPLGGDDHRFRSPRR